MERERAKQLQDRLEARTRDWSVAPRTTLETETSIVVFGSRKERPVVLKVLKALGDEWHSGNVLDAFDGNGVVRVYEYVEGTVLLERLTPGYSLVHTVLDGRDDDASDVLAGVIQKMSVGRKPSTCPTVEDWARGFDRYLASGNSHVPKTLVDEARQIYLELCASQQSVRLLHGDLHHYNVLFDDRRGWLAIDPKGVIGEVEYEIGAILRNPIEQPDLFTSQAVVERRVTRFTAELPGHRRTAFPFGTSHAEGPCTSPRRDVPRR